VALILSSPIPHGSFSIDVAEGIVTENEWGTHPIHSCLPIGGVRTGQNFMAPLLSGDFFFEYVLTVTMPIVCIRTALFLSYTWFYLNPLDRSRLC
jgi:hypothetical protein